MVETTDNNLRLVLPTVGGDDNLWGGLLNTLISEMERSLTDVLGIALSSTDHTLTTTGDAGEEARKMVLNCTGTLSQNVDIIAPLEPKLYIIKNDTDGGSFTVSIKTPTGSSPLDIPRGDTLLVWCDVAADTAKGEFFPVSAPVSGVTALATNALQLGGVVAANYAQRAVRNTWTFPQTVQAIVRTLTADAYTPDYDTDSVILIKQDQIGGNPITMNNPDNTPVDGQVLTFMIEQHDTVAQSVVWGTEYIFQGDINLDLTQTIDKVDTFTFLYNLGLDRLLNVGNAINFPRS